ncbi:hypothetical protein D3C87_290330 [compost metagenome]
MKTLWALFICAFSLTATAQEVYKCEDNFKVFEGKMLVKEYNDVYTMLPDLRKSCPKFNDKLYKYGETVLKYQIEVARTPEQQKIFVDDLVALYSEQEKNFPGSGGDVKKTMLQNEYKLIADDEAYKSLNASFSKNRQAFTDYNALEKYFMLFLEQYKSGKGITDEQYIEKYGEITGQIAYTQNKINTEKDAVLKKQETQMLTDEDRLVLSDAKPTLDALDAVNDNVSILSKNYLSCEKMEVYYSKNYEDHEKDVAWLEAMASALFEKKCYNSLVLNKGALAINTLKPTKQSAHRLGTLALRKGNTKDAVKYFEQSAALEVVPEKRGDLYYEIASVLKNSDKAEAKKYALKAVEFNPKTGKPYLMLAEMYNAVTTECELTDFEKKALMWLAIDTAKKAEIAEPKYKATVAAVTATYDKKKPTKDLAKAARKGKGDTITYGCWINETVTVPKL